MSEDQEQVEDEVDVKLEAAKADLRSKKIRAIVATLGSEGDEYALIFRYLDQKKSVQLTRQLGKAIIGKGDQAKPDVPKTMDILTNQAKFQCIYGREHLDYLEEQYPHALAGEVMDRLMEIARGCAKFEVL